MPAIRSQTVNSDGFTLTTSSGNTLQVIITLAGNIHTVTCKKNGVTEQAPTVTNATTTILENLINNWMNGNFPGVGGGNQQMYNACHIFTLTPLTLITITSIAPITGEWWL